MESRIKSFIVCKQLSKLLETCIAIVSSLPQSERAKLPSVDLMEMGMTALDESYPELIKNGKWDVKAIEKFSSKPENTFIADAILKNFNELDEDVKNNMKSKNEKYFIENFSNLIKSVPGIDDDQKEKFGAFATSNSLSDDDKEDIWCFVEFIVTVLESDDVNEFLPN